VKIDSDVLDGQVNALFGRPPEKNFQPSNAIQSAPQVVLSSGQHMRDMQVLSPSTGWVLQGNHLLWTADSGLTWQKISPLTGRNDILGVHFINPDQGWLIGRQASEDGAISLSIYQTNDAGNTWSENPVSNFSSADAWELESANFEFLDHEKGWIALKLHSGSNFSFGRLLATEDGGRTWQVRELPLGEPVVFQDALRGWTAGGPRDQVYITEDGGESWILSENQTARDFNMLSSNGQQLLVGEMPQGVVSLDIIDNQVGWAVIQEGTCTGYKPRAGEHIPTGETPLQCESISRLVRTTNSGINWSEITPPE